MLRMCIGLSALAAVLMAAPSRSLADDTKKDDKACCADGKCCCADEKMCACGAEKLGWKLALQSWTVQGNVMDAIGLAKQSGVKYIEIFPGQTINPDGSGKFGPEMSDAEIKAVMDKAKDAGITITSFGVTGIPGDEAGAKKFFDWAKKLGLITIVTESSPGELAQLDKLAGEYGMKIALHNHPKPSPYWDPAHAYEVTKDLKNVGFCADVGHWRRSGLDPVEVLKKYGDKVVSMHFKDLKSTEDLHDVIWGTGTSHADEMMKIMKDKGFKGVVAIEFEYKWDVPTLQKCVEFFYGQAKTLSGEK